MEGAGSIPAPRGGPRQESTTLMDLGISHWRETQHHKLMPRVYGLLKESLNKNPRIENPQPEIIHDLTERCLS